MNNVQPNVALESTVTVKIQLGNNVQPKALLLLRGMDDKYVRELKQRCFRVTYGNRK